MNRVEESDWHWAYLGTWVYDDMCLACGVIKGSFPAQNYSGHFNSDNLLT